MHQEFFGNGEFLVLDPFWFALCRGQIIMAYPTINSSGRTHRQVVILTYECMWIGKNTHSQVMD